MRITDYWMDREAQYAADLTDDIRANAAITVNRANNLLQEFGENRGVRSGWRPPAVNASTPNAAPNSKHMTGQAVDISDPTGDLGAWCLDNPGVLERIGIWMEHPSKTPTWAHCQIVPPKSGNRFFYP